MGTAFTKLFSKLTMNIVMIGLDGSGKTTLLYRLRLGEVVTSIPTIGLNVETLEYKDVKFSCWDVGGSTRISQLYKHYYADLNGFIFMVDSSDHDRLENAKYELFRAMDSAESRVPLLVFANKQDLERLTAQQIAKALDIEPIKDRDCLVMGCSTTTREGLYEGLEWLANAVKRQTSVSTSQSKFTNKILQKCNEAKVEVDPETGIACYPNSSMLDWFRTNIIQRSNNSQQRNQNLTKKAEFKPEIMKPTILNLKSNEESKLNEEELTIKDDKIEDNTAQEKNEEKECVICTVAKAEIAFIPCGHKKTCTACSDKLIKSNKPVCPICRSNIKNGIKVFE